MSPGESGKRDFPALGSCAAPPSTRTQGALARLSVRFGALADPAASLSGGNQQRLVLARELEREPRLLIAAQPTRGVDIAGTAFIHRLIGAFRDRGGAVLLVSESLDEIIALSDRIVCLFNGRIIRFPGD